MTMPPTSLGDLLCNTVVLSRLAPYLSVTSVLALEATSKSYRHVLQDAPDTHRYLDLSGCKAAIIPDMSVDHGGINWRSERMDEALSEDDIYCGPLRGIFSIMTRKNALQHVQTMILDGLTVPADLVQEIVSTTNVRILSIREAKQLNQAKLIQVLKYAVRPSRPSGMPMLRGLYVFGPKDGQRHYTRKDALCSAVQGYTDGVTSSEGAQIGATWNPKSHDSLTSSLTRCTDRWYQPSGKMFSIAVPYRAPWAEALQACEGIIAFDAILCGGPRHDAAKYYSSTPVEDSGRNGSWLVPMVANVALGYGCVECKSSSEGPVIYETSETSRLPLLDPPLRHSSAMKDAQRPTLISGSTYPSLYARCEECLTARWCERCLKWWDERCYPPKVTDRRISEVREAAMALDPTVQSVQQDIRVFLGLCTSSCLVSEEMYGSGSGGMWG